MKYDLVHFSNNKIEAKSQNVTKFDNSVTKIVNAMFDAINKHNGIGLAAIQVGVPLRIIVADIGLGKFVAINPEILWRSEELEEMEEGNLSLPNAGKIKIVRPTKIKIKYKNLSGKEKEMETDGLLARCIQHEMEQLDGITILDHI